MTVYESEGGGRECILLNFCFIWIKGIELVAIW
jgi:hypothetical protein